MIDVVVDAQPTGRGHVFQLRPQRIAAVDQREQIRIVARARPLLHFIQQSFQALCVRVRAAHAVRRRVDGVANADQIDEKTVF